MPSKSKRKGSSRKPLLTTNGAQPLSQTKTLDDYFDNSPTSNNNDLSPQITSETVFYYHGAADVKQDDELTLGIESVGCLSTPEISPEKTSPSIKQEPVVTRSQTNASAEVSLAKEDDSSSDEKLKRRGRTNKMKPEVSKQQNHLVTDFFPVRKSSRKTAKELQREHDELMRNLILDECEDGLKIVQLPGKGRGVEATKPFKKGDFVVEYAGDLVELKEAKFREEHYKKDTSYGCYMYFFNHKGTSYCVDATRESGKLGRLLNHSRTNPNCMTKTIDIGDRAYLILIAARDIQVGEELVYDYGDRSKEAIENNPWLRE